jgi:sensor histidine kinase YesM
MPKDEGGFVIITVDKTDHTIKCTIDDNGIGREVSKQNKFIAKSSSSIKRRAFNRGRLNLYNLLNKKMQV